MSLEDHIKANTEAVLAFTAEIKKLPADLAKVLSSSGHITPGAITPKADKADPVADFIATLSSINWKWEDLDEAVAFRAGKAAVAAAKETATKLGKKALAAFEAAQKAGLAGEPAAAAASDSSATSAESGTAGTEGAGGVVIALSDLQVFTGMIQAFKTKDAENGPKAIEELKKFLETFGVKRLSEPGLKPEKYPEVKAGLEAIVAKYKIPAIAA